MVPPEIVRRIHQAYGCHLSICYGQTESSPNLTQTGPGDDDQDRFDTAGQPLPMTGIAIRDPATNAVAPLGAVGEICARGYGLMLGYNDNPQATAHAFPMTGAGKVQKFVLRDRFVAGEFAGKL